MAKHKINSLVDSCDRGASGKKFRAATKTVSAAEHALRGAVSSVFSNREISLKPAKPAGRPIRFK